LPFAPFFGFRIIKKEGIVFPLSIVFKALGGIPVYRDSSQGTVNQMVAMFEKYDDFRAIVPEGTRKGVRTIKTGFWHIAKAADVSIICWYLDNESKVTRWLGELTPGEDKAEDMLTIQGIYASAGYDIPLDVAALNKN
jgi:1-acyl-sn-glycerol-3-phosphate acyltransferase